MLNVTRHTALVVLLLVSLISCSVPPPPIDINSLLLRNRVADVERYFDDVQSRFENGELDEIGFRDEMQKFYVLDDVAVSNLEKWASSTPESHIAHLGYGIFLKRQGRESRGTQYIKDTDPNALRLADDYFELAQLELTKSRVLTEKPYMEIFHLLDIAGVTGDDEALDDLIKTANSILPDNSLSRMRRAHYLLPRWGGSYEEFDRFYDASRAEGAPEVALLRMEAIKYQDLASVAENSGDIPLAMAYDELALLIGEQVGGSFIADSLGNSLITMCYPANVQSYCRERSEFN